MTEQCLDKHQMEILRRLLAGVCLPPATRAQDRARQNLRKRGLIAFDRVLYQWIWTEKGRDAYVRQAQ